jgi:hypothetical protein
MTHHNLIGSVCQQYPTALYLPEHDFRLYPDVEIMDGLVGHLEFDVDAILIPAALAAAAFGQGPADLEAVSSWWRSYPVIPAPGGKSTSIITRATVPVRSGQGG